MTSDNCRLANEDSMAAKAAPASWRQWTMRTGLRDTASQNGAIPPPKTPNPYLTPRRAISLTNASDTDCVSSSVSRSAGACAGTTMLCCGKVSACESAVVASRISLLNAQVNR